MMYMEIERGIVTPVAGYYRFEEKLEAVLVVG
jgi:hypothetical protein